MPVFDNLSLISILLMAVQFFIVVSVVIRVILTRHPPGDVYKRQTGLEQRSATIHRSFMPCKSFSQKI